MKYRSMPKKPSDFDTLAFEIHVHLDPKIMNEKIDAKGLDTEKLKKYSDLIHTMNMAFKKIQKYELYFSEFFLHLKRFQKMKRWNIMFMHTSRI